MPNLDEILRTPQAEKIMGNREKLGSLMTSPETQKIMELLNRNSGGNLEQIAGNAEKGDTAQLMNAIRQLMQNPEASQLIQQMKNKMK